MSVSSSGAARVKWAPTLLSGHTPQWKVFYLFVVLFVYLFAQ